jgi:hypothetical protein
VGGSSFPLSELRFGDFTGDGVTDVLAVVGSPGRWNISESARQQWRVLNPSLGDPVAGLVIANMDQDDNIDDVLHLERHRQILTAFGMPFGEKGELIWWRSKNGTSPWKEFDRYSFNYQYETLTEQEALSPRFGLALRFGTVMGATLVIDERRFGHFSARVGDSPPFRWTSLFPY